MNKYNARHRLIADNGHYIYIFCAMNLYFPLPNPFTASINPAFFSLVMRLPAAVTELFVYRGYIGTTKNAVNVHVCKDCFCFFNRNLACVQSLNRNLFGSNRNICAVKQLFFIFNRNIFICKTQFYNWLFLLYHMKQKISIY